MNYVHQIENSYLNSSNDIQVSKKLILKITFNINLAHYRSVDIQSLHDIVSLKDRVHEAQDTNNYHLTSNLQLF